MKFKISSPLTKSCSQLAPKTSKLHSWAIKLSSSSGEGITFRKAEKKEKMYYPSNDHHHHGKYVPQGPPCPVPPPGVLNTTYTPPAEYQHPSYSSSNMPVQVHGTTQVWSTRLCHCFDDPSNCLITSFCPCVTFGQIAEIANRGSSTCVWHGAVYAILCMTGFPCLYSCFYRSKLRGQYDLEEAPCEDCLVHLGCEMCALCQEHRELKNHGFDMEIGWQANMDRRSRGVSLVAPVMDGGMRR